MKQTLSLAENGRMFLAFPRGVFQSARFIYSHYRRSLSGCTNDGNLLASLGAPRVRLPQPLAVPVAAKPSEVEEAAAAYGVEGPSGLAQDFALGWPWQLWERRQFLGRTALWGLVLSTLAAFVIPKRYESTTQLMPPDTQSSSGMAMMAALGGKGGTGLSSLADGLLGMKSTGDLFISILHSRTVEDRLVERFDLRRAIWDRYRQNARKDLAKNTGISEGRKSGVTAITVTDRDPQRAAQMARAYVEELDRLVAQVSTSSARRERIFIEQRLAAVKQDLTVPPASSANTPAGTRPSILTPKARRRWMPQRSWMGN